MSNLIRADLATQVMTCRVCLEQHEIPRPLLRDQHALMERVDEVTLDHRECAAHPQDPRLAAMHRQFRKRVERQHVRRAA